MSIHVTRPLFVAALIALAHPAAAATYQVTINTAPLVGHPAGPFAIMFALTDGSGIGDGNNTVTIGNVDFGGGNAADNPFVWGDATGSLSSSIHLRDTTGASSFTESFTPGTLLRFSLTVTGADDEGEVPDRLSVFVLDTTGVRVPTSAEVADSLIGIDLHSGPLLPEAFGGNANRRPTIGGAIALDRPTLELADSTPPTTTATTAGLTGNSGWYRGPVAITLSASDADSGVAAIAYALDGGAASTYAAPLLIQADGIHQLSYRSTDAAGNQEAWNVLTVKIDATRPSIVPSRAPAANGNGWNNTSVTVSFACTDDGSGLAAGSPPASVVVSATGAGQSVDGTCTDVAGNTSSVTVSNINVDLAAPTITVAASAPSLWPPNGKLVPDVISGSIADALSGVDASSATFDVVDEYGLVQPAGRVSLGSDGRYAFTVMLDASRHGQDSDGRQYRITVTATDNAGNRISASTLVTVRHDHGR